MADDRLCQAEHRLSLGGVLRCDLMRGHDGLWHVETYVAKWRRDADPELRWCVNSGDIFAKPRYEVAEDDA